MDWRVGRREDGFDWANEGKQDEYSILNSKHFIGIHGYMLVYSVASTQSFEMVQVIRDKILNHLVCPLFPLHHPHSLHFPPFPSPLKPQTYSAKGSEWVPIVIVGNKSDLRPEQRQVSPEQGKALAESFKCATTEASARYNENVSKAFELMIGQIEKAQNPNEPTGGGKGCVVM